MSKTIILYDGKVEVDDLLYERLFKPFEKDSICKVDACVEGILNVIYYEKGVLIKDPNPLVRRELERFTSWKPISKKGKEILSAEEKEHKKELAVLSKMIKKELKKLKKHWYHSSKKSQELREKRDLLAKSLHSIASEYEIELENFFLLETDELVKLSEPVLERIKETVLELFRVEKRRFSLW